MIIVYELMEAQDKKNTYNATPIMVEKCCNESMLWFFRYSIDMIVKENIILKRSGSENNTYADRFNHCQFCGEKHRFYTIEEYQDLKRIEKDNK